MHLHWSPGSAGSKQQEQHQHQHQQQEPPAAQSRPSISTDPGRLSSRAPALYRSNQRDKPQRQSSVTVTPHHTSSYHHYDDAALHPPTACPPSPTSGIVQHGILPPGTILSTLFLPNLHLRLRRPMPAHMSTYTFMPPLLPPPPARLLPLVASLSQPLLVSPIPLPAPDLGRPRQTAETAEASEACTYTTLASHAIRSPLFDLQANLPSSIALVTTPNVHYLNPAVLFQRAYIWLPTTILFRSRSEPPLSYLDIANSTTVDIPPAATLLDST
ncbi:hypothetical protein VDGL01_00458 [Verticillium dahliae]